MNDVWNDSTRRNRAKARWSGLLFIVMTCSLLSSTALGQPPSHGKSGTTRAPSMTDAVDRSLVSSSGAAPAVTVQDIVRAEPHDREELQQLADEVRQTLGTVRQLENPHPVSLVVRTEAELRTYIMEKLDDMGDDVIAAGERMMQMLQILPKDVVYRDLVTQLLGAQVAGYYEPEDQQFYILDTDIQNFDPTVIAHELQHAAQDRHWDLQRLMRPKWRHDDIQAARSALIEGDATLTMLAFGAEREVEALPKGYVAFVAEMIGSGMDELRDTYPGYVLDSLGSSYSNGLRFADALYAAGGWKQVDAAFEKPPLSTEQVLYPERYLEMDEPTLLSFDLSPARYGERRDSNVLGMASMRYLFLDLLSGRLSDPAIEQATSLWDGDRMELWSRPEGDLLVWLSVFDEERGAQDFFDLLEFAMPRWVVGVSTCAGSFHGGRCGVVADNQGLLIERWGDLVLMILAENHAAKSVDAPWLLQAAEEVWSTHRRARYPEIFR